MRRSMRRSALPVTAAALVAALASGVLPAGADGTGTVSGSLSAVLSPQLTSGFPCGDSAVNGLDAIQRFFGAVADPYPGCRGSIYATAANAATLSLAGVHGGPTGAVPWTVSGVGNISADYSYNEPCQATGAGPQALTGEAIGTITISGPALVGHYGDGAATGASVSARFWWSRVGPSVLVGLRDVAVELAVPGAGTIHIHNPFATGLGAAAFVPQTTPDCTAARRPTPGPNEIIVIAGAIELG